MVSIHIVYCILTHNVLDGKGGLCFDEAGVRYKVRSDTMYTTFKATPTMMIDRRTWETFGNCYVGRNTCFHQVILKSTEPFNTAVCILY